MSIPQLARTVRETLASAFKKGMSNSEALEDIRDANPRSKMTVATVNWYRNRLRDEGAKIPTDREARKPRRRY